MSHKFFVKFQTS